MKKTKIQAFTTTITLILIVTTILLIKPDSISYFDLVGFMSIVNIFVAFFIFANKRVYEDKLTWIIIILLFPLVGVVLYVMLGIDYSTARKNKGHIYTEEQIAKFDKSEKLPFEFKHRFQDNLDFIELIENMTKKPITFNNRTKLLNNGDEFFPRLFEEIKKAEVFINIESFIIKDGKITDELFELLMEKAREGVEVRVLVDFVGGVRLSKSSIKHYRDNGIDFRMFNPITKTMIFDGLNYRNHRKIVVIDGKVGFTGGINIGDEYNHGDPYYGFWRDSHLVYTGDGVKSLNIVFVKDWYYTTGEDLLNEKYLFDYRCEDDFLHGLQVIDDGPDTHTNILKNVFFKAIMEAKSEIRLSTPYLIPDSEILLALKVASLSGIKVDIIVPGKPDKKLVYHATMSYFRELLEAGCNIYFYGDNFMHSKILIIDNSIASIGSTNIDFRSFHLQFEDTILLYNDPTIKDLIHSFEEDLYCSRQVNYQDWIKRPIYKKLIEAIAKVFSPLF